MPGLNFQQAPPISVPLRFFLTAPWFALLSALVLLSHPDELFVTRWSPVTLASVHLLTLGFMTMVMIGAMMQMLPVLAGAPLPKPRWIAVAVHATLLPGTLLFAGSSLFAQPAWLQLAVPLLAIALSVFCAAVLLVLWRSHHPTPTVVAMRLAALSLAVTLIMGLSLSASRGWGWMLANPALRDLHPAWGLFGWTNLLLVGVAYHIVPMFQMTPIYPPWLTRRFAPMIFILLTLCSVAKWQGDSWHALNQLGDLLLTLCVVGFAMQTLYLQRLRRRRLPDVTLEFWRVGLLSILLAALLWLAQDFALVEFAHAEVVLGVLLIIGGVMSFITGMLCKIVPFLAWFHLQAKSTAGSTLPNVKDLLPESAQRWQLRLHLLALLLCLAAIYGATWLAYAAALVFGASALTLLWNMLRVVQRYHHLNSGLSQ